MIDDKSEAQKAHEDGQKDGAAGDAINYNGWVHSDNIDQYNAGFRNALENARSDDDD